MTYSNGYTKEDHRLATRMSRIRKKIKEKRATQMERAELADYERSKGKRARPTEPETASAEVAPVVETPATPQNEPVEVQNTLPGMGGDFVPPPLNVDASGVPPVSPTQSAGAPPPSATTAAGATPTVKPAPAMSKEEAAMQGEMLANVATQILSEFNAFNIKAGMSGITDPFLKMFHFSVKRLATKYGAAIDEDQYDALVIVGAGGWVGFNTYKAYRAQEKEKVIEMPKEAPTNGQQSRPQPAPPVERAARTVWSGGPGDQLPRGFRGGRGDQFDPDGPY